jgi:hypothetical protein
VRGLSALELWSLSNPPVERSVWRYLMKVRCWLTHWNEGRILQRMRMDQSALTQRACSRDGEIDSPHLANALFGRGH